MKKNELLSLTAFDYTEKGHAVCKHEGFVVFVPELLLHEEADIRILKVQAKHAFGKVEKRLRSNPQRVKPNCPIASKCGGCQIQHMAYEHQLEFKQSRVQSLFDHHLNQGIVLEPILGMDNPWTYRNKALVPYDEHLNYGFYQAHSHTIIPFESCVIQSEDANSVLAFIQDFYKTKDVSFPELRHVLIKKAFKTHELMVVLVVNDLLIPYRDELIQALTQTYTSLKSLQLNLNTRSDNVVLGDHYELLYGQAFITDELDGLRFEISAPSFYQVNPSQTVKLYQKALDYADLKGQETVLDLYCGIGTIALFASRQAKKVIGVEVVPEAIEDAKRNAALNSIENVEWFCGDAGQVSQSLNTKVDVVIVDPPRKGLDALSKEMILSLLPSKFIYISCDPATLVRDLKEFMNQYSIVKAGCVDLFPQTYHVETVVLLTRKSS